MRCSLLKILPLSVAIHLFLAGTSVGAPTNHDRHEERISSHDAPVRSLGIPSTDAMTGRTAPEEGGRHVRHKRAILTPSNHPAPALIQRHNHIMDHLRLHPGGSPLAKRSLVGDLTVMGFRLIWDHADVIVSSALAYYRTTEYYANMTIIAGGEFGFGPTVQNHMITYGVFRLTFEIMVDAVAGMGREAFGDGGFGQFLREFAQVMQLITTVVVVGTYTILAWSAMTAVWITMIIVENADEPRLVTGP